VAVVLRCAVRGCAESLTQEGTRWACAKGHSFDQHRTGSLNLLQPQDRRSKHPGDSREAAQARRRLAGIGHADAVYRAFSHVIGSRSEGKRATLLDVGCGEGSFLRHVAGIAGLERHGVDISAPSIELAAKASPDVLFVVANADRFLPYADQAFDFVTSIDARVNASEFERVLKKDGLVLVAVPASDDLIELRERVQGGKVEKSRAARIEEELGKSLRLADRTTVRDSRTFEPSVLRDLLTVTYRGFRQSERAAVESLAAMKITLSHEVLAFERR
jgi:23S rRNA (guanine745-N1)-methyltransferase